MNYDCNKPGMKQIARLVSYLVIVGTMSQTALANPKGGTVAAGQATITEPDSKTLQVNQASDKVIINWGSFNIDADETTRFVQPSSKAWALNRVVGSQDPSKILGNLQANGNVVIVNPDGILFGPNSRIDVNSLIATTHDIKNEDFMAGQFDFTIPGDGKASIVNLGSISIADQGIGAFVAPGVRNQGIIAAKFGKVEMAAANGFTLDFYGDELVKLVVDDEIAGEVIDVETGKPMADLVSNQGTIKADGGVVALTSATARKAVNSVINNIGVIEARTIGSSKGTIKLIAAGDDGLVKVGGTLDASAPDGGDGGFIETSAAKVQVTDDAKVTTLASNGKTGTWLIDPTDFTIYSGSGALTGSGIGADTLSSSLASSNVTLQTDNVSGTDDGDINVNAAVIWNADTTLILDAYADININADISAATGTLKLYYGQGGSSSAYYLNDGAQVNLSAGNHFYTKVCNWCFESNWIVITALGAAGSTSGADLQGINGNLTSYYVLGVDIDASSTSGWNSGAGFDPIGDYSTKFTGRFDGLGHIISNMTINRSSTDYVGLFGYIGGGGSSIANVGLDGGSVSGRSHTGGLVGRNDYGNIRDSYTTGTVSGSSGRSYIGGLVGDNNYGTVSNSYSTGVVRGTYHVGGLVGFNNHGTVSNSYAVGAVRGNLRVGGLVGQSYGNIKNSYASGEVYGTYYVGGLVGLSMSAISNSYATGAVGGDGHVGGLVGYNYTSASISNSYATGAISCGHNPVGGLVGDRHNDTVSDSYWDIDSTGMSTSPGGTGKTTSEMKSGLLAGFDSSVWGISASVNDGYPYLLWQDTGSGSSGGGGSQSGGGGAGTVIGDVGSAGDTGDWGGTEDGGSEACDSACEAALLDHFGNDAGDTGDSGTGDDEEGGELIPGESEEKGSDPNNHNPNPESYSQQVLDGLILLLGLEADMVDDHVVNVIEISKKLNALKESRQLLKISNEPNLDEVIDGLSTQIKSLAAKKGGQVRASDVKALAKNTNFAEGLKILGEIFTIATVSIDSYNILHDALSGEIDIQATEKYIEGIPFALQGVYGVGSRYTTFLPKGGMITAGVSYIAVGFAALQIGAKVGEVYTGVSVSDTIKSKVDSAVTHLGYLDDFASIALEAGKSGKSLDDVMTSFIAARQSAVNSMVDSIDFIENHKVQNILTGNVFAADKAKQDILAIENLIIDLYSPQTITDYYNAGYLASEAQQVLSND